MTVDTDSIDPVRGFFDECVFGFIYHDIQAAIDGNANYLAALGLVAYTEFIGGLINGTLGDSGKRKKRFYTFWNRMGPEYQSGSVHSYFIAQTQQ